MNPLLQTVGLVAYDEIRPEHVGPALDALLANARAEIARLSVPSIAATWDDLVEPLEDATERLARAWGAVEHLSSVVDTPELRAAYNDNLARITEFWTFLAQDQIIFTKYRSLERSEDFAKLSASRRRVVNNALRDFVLGGAELDGANKQRFGAIQEELASLGQKFAENVLDATAAFEYIVTDVTELAGLPDDVIEAARRCAQSAGLSGYKLTLQAPSYLPVMQYATNRELRRAMYQGYVERASAVGAGQFDNSEVITRILALRREEAMLLGYENFAQLSLVPKMAGSPSEVVTFLDDLARRARPFAVKDVEELRRFAARALGIEQLEVWDQRFASEKLRQAEYAFSEQEVKEYFTESRVLDGLFKTIESLFGVSISADTGPTWHPDVRFFRVENQRKELVAQFYLDLYARTGKRGGAWADASRSRRRRSQGLQTPVSLLVCNFTEPLPGKSAQFTHDEVITLFHEFGHGLHGMLTEVDERAVAGTNGVEWDAVELPSQFMENFCWEWDVVRSMSAHVLTGAQLPRALFERMRAAKNFQAGLDTLRQVEFGLFDMGLHSALRCLDADDVQSILDNVRNGTSIIKVPAYNRFQNQFSHIFAGSYAAGYYSYKWAELLSADAYGSFEEEGVLNAATGARFAQEVLARGGSRPALESFVAFRGRKPDIAALLRIMDWWAPEKHALKEILMNRTVLLTVVLLVCASAAQAQYKSVAPDGTVTYSDQPPAANSKVVAVKALDSGSASSVSTAGLPFETQQAAQRFPVTLYTADKCPGCDQARTYLRSRGVPFSERTVSTDSDRAALKKLSPDGNVPVVEVGRQRQIGFSPSIVAAMLDDARYPADGKLPAGYQNPAPKSLAPPASTDVAAKKTSPSDAAAPNSSFPDVPPPTGNAPAGFKF